MNWKTRFKIWMLSQIRMWLPYNWLYIEFNPTVIGFGPNVDFVSKIFTLDIGPMRFCVYW